MPRSEKLGDKLADVFNTFFMNLCVAHIYTSRKIHPQTPSWILATAISPTNQLKILTSSLPTTYLWSCKSISTTPASFRKMLHLRNPNTFHIFPRIDPQLMPVGMMQGQPMNRNLDGGQGSFPNQCHQLMERKLMIQWFPAASMYVSYCAKEV